MHTSQWRRSFHRDDPQLGRWLQVDPADEFHSPYVYCHNDPVNFFDPDGASEESDLLLTGNVNEKYAVMMRKEEIDWSTVGLELKSLSLKLTSTVSKGADKMAQSGVVTGLVAGGIGLLYPPALPFAAFAFEVAGYSSATKLASDVANDLIANNKVDNETVKDAYVFTAGPLTGAGISKIYPSSIAIVPVKALDDVSKAMFQTPIDWFTEKAAEKIQK